MNHPETPEAANPTPTLDDISELVFNVDEGDAEIPGDMEAAWAPLYGPGTYAPTGATVPKLGPGVYFATAGDKGPFLVGHKLVTDELIEMPDEREVALRQQVGRFMKAGHLYRKFGYAHRRGILLHGPAGSGKTCLLQLFIKKHVAEGGIVVYFKTHPAHCSALVTAITKIQPDTMIIGIIEELEAYISSYNEASLLQILDGEDSMRNTIVIATTNYPEQLDRRIINRPRRFDHVQYVGMPSAEVRAVYFHKKLHIETDELVEWVAESEDFSFAAMAELVISVKCLEKPLAEAAADLRKMMRATPKSEDWGAAIKSTPTATLKTKSGLLKPDPAKSISSVIVDELLDRMTKKMEVPKAHPFTGPIIAAIDRDQDQSAGDSCSTA